jgi:hypothetical protein
MEPATLEGSVGRQSPFRWQTKQSFVEVRAQTEFGHERKNRRRSSRLAIIPRARLEQTMTRFRIAISILAVAMSCTEARAIWMRSSSIEWWTNVSDTVVIAEVSRVNELKPSNESSGKEGFEKNGPNEYRLMQEVACTTRTTLKGRSLGEFSFQQVYERIKDESGARGDRKLRAKEKVVIFQATDSKTHKSEIIFLVNLAKPDGKFAPHAAYDNSCKWLTAGDDVVDLVKKRIAQEDPVKKSKKRGVIVDFTQYKEGDMHWDFVRTADPEFRETLVKMLKEGEKESAIYNLVSYPGKETVNLIKPFLTDPTIHEMERYNGKDEKGNPIYKKVAYYPLREYAYRALILLGESPEKPEHLVDGPLLWHFATGFENAAYFPYGDWKRLERKLR